MTRENAKKWAEIFSAYAEGKTIQNIRILADGYELWRDVDFGNEYIDLRYGVPYRVKPLTESPVRIKFPFDLLTKEEVIALAKSRGIQIKEE